MNFLTSFLTSPLMAGLGLLLGSVPIIIHILNRTFYQKMDWAAMEFLLRAEEKTRRRVQLENLLLLLLRFLLLALLGFALAQPFFNTPVDVFGAETKKHMIVVVDDSYSMSKKKPEAGGAKKTVFDDARNRAKKLVENNFRPENGDRISILTASANPREIVGDPSQDRSRAIDLIEELEPSNYGADLKSTIDLLKQNVDKIEDENMEKKVFWFTDMQQNSWFPEEQKTGQEIKEKLNAMTDSVDSVALVDVGTKRTDNLGIVDLSMDREFVVTDQGVSVTAQVRNFSGNNKTGTITLYRDNQKVESLDLNIKPNSTVPKEFRDVRFSDTGPHNLHVELETDKLEPDNRRYRALNVKKKIDVLIVDGDMGEASKTENESFFVETALNPSEGSSPFSTKVVSDFMFRDQSLLNFDLVILANLSTVREARKQDLTRFVKRGGGVLMFLGDEVTIEQYNEVLLDAKEPFLPGKLEELVERSYQEGNLARLTDVEFSHPIFQIFEDYPQHLSALITQKWIRVTVDPEDPNTWTLANFDDAANSPAILERLIGQGKLLTVTTSADQEWNLWSNFQGFPILVNEMAQYLLGQRMGVRNIKVGDVVDLPVTEFDYNKKFRLTDPEDRQTTLNPRSLRDGGYVLNLRDLDEMGIYSLRKESEEANKKWVDEDVIAVNLEPSEGDLTRTSKKELENAYPKFDFQFVGGGTQEQGQTEMKEKKSNIWKVLAFLLIGFLALESLLALRIDRRREVG